MPLYLIIEKGEIVQVAEYETMYRAQKYMEQEGLNEALLAVVVGHYSVKEIQERIRKPEKAQRRKK